jgi:peptidoglycan/xylan/chitin deacetylase (PgdA/CDA1 family)
MKRLLVVCWHNVEPSWTFPAARLDGFERQLRVLAAAGDVVALSDGLDALAGNGRLSPRAVALTFDDGYRDNLERAVPLLQRLGLPATFFLVPGLLSGTVEPWWETLYWAFTRRTCQRLAWEGERVDGAGPQRWRAALDRIVEELKRRPAHARDRVMEDMVRQLAPAGSRQERAAFMDWDGARRLVAHGFSVGSHSLTHPILSQEAPERQLQELAESRRLLEDRLGVTVDVVAYPNGRAQDFTVDTVAGARAGGYRYGLTTIEGWNSPATGPYEIRRFVLMPDEGLHGLRPLPRRAWAAVRGAARGR